MLTTGDNPIPKNIAQCILNNIMSKYTPAQFNSLENTPDMSSYITNVTQSCMGGGVDGGSNSCSDNSGCKSGQKCVKNICTKAGLSTGVIIGIVVSGFAILLLLIWYFSMRTKGYKGVSGRSSSISSY